MFKKDDPGSALIHLRKMKRGCDSDYETTKEKVKVRFVQIGISSDQKDCVVHYDKPVLLFTRIRSECKKIFNFCDKIFICFVCMMEA